MYKCCHVQIKTAFDVLKTYIFASSDSVTTNVVDSYSHYANSNFNMFQRSFHQEWKVSFMSDIF